MKFISPCKYCKKENRTCVKGYSYSYNESITLAEPNKEMCEIEYIEQKAGITKKHYTHFWKEGNIKEIYLPPKWRLFRDFENYFRNKKGSEVSFNFGYETYDEDDDED
jgi:hypothetical protein